VSVETGAVVEWTSEVNYRFRLSAFRDSLLEFYSQHPSWIRPQSRMDLVTKWVQAGLDDLSVSRPAQRVQWGIPVPHDASQNIYVWLDALMNYAVQAGYPWPPEWSSAGGWPADVHVIGKDILRFHCIYWPAFLMALGLPLPKQIISHAHWTIGKEKMSKSVGNVVDPFTVVDTYGVDVVRWFLALEGRLDNDSDFNNQTLTWKYDDLRGKLGNFSARLTRGRFWNVREAIRLGTSSGSLMETPSDPDDAVVFEAIRGLRDHITPSVDHYDVRASLRRVMEVIALVRHA
jgi:methionyl-tRNA synthetase